MRTRSDDLEILLAVVDSGGFSAAADTLDIQVARVSRSVSRLEQQLGTSLLNRTTRRIDLTTEGRNFVETVRQGLQQLHYAEDQLLSQGDTPQGRLRVDAASPFIFHQLIDLIKPFQQQYPHIELELTSNEGYVDLLEKKTDLAIRIGTLSDSTLHARLLGNSLLYLVASPDYIEQHGMPQSVAELAHHQIIGFTAPKFLNNLPFKNMPHIKPSLLVSNGETMRQLALAGNGIACLSGFMVNKDIEQGRLVSILEAERLTNTGREKINAVYYQSSTISKRISAFIDFIQPRLTL